MMKGLINKIIRIIKMKIKIKRLFEVITKRVDFVNLDVKINIFKGFEIYNNSDKIACFEFDEMCRVKIPLPPIEVQQAIVNIYKCANEAKRIAEEADRLSREVCPALLQHVIHS